MKKNIVCITGDCDNVQMMAQQLLDEGYNVLGVQSQFLFTAKGYERPKSIMWLIKDGGKPNEQR